MCEVEDLHGQVLPSCCPDLDNSGQFFSLVDSRQRHGVPEMCSVWLGHLAEKYSPWLGWPIVRTIEFPSISELRKMQFSTCHRTFGTIAP